MVIGEMMVTSLTEGVCGGHALRSVHVEMSTNNSNRAHRKRVVKSSL